MLVGLILAEALKDIDPRSEMKLSDLLKKFYSEEGIQDTVNRVTFRACDRLSLYQPKSNLEIQAKSFAYYFNNKTSAGLYDANNVNSFNTLVSSAVAKMNNVVGEDLEEFNTVC